MGFGFGFSFGFAALVQPVAPEPDPELPATNLTGLYFTQDDADFSFSAGDSVATIKENDARLSGDLDYAFVSGTRAVKTSTHPVNTDEETLDTNEAFGDYRTPAGGTLADLLPSGVGTVYFKMFLDSHPDAFNAPDHIFYAGASGVDLRIDVVDGPRIRVQTDSGAQSVQSAVLSLDAWYTVCVRLGNGANQLKLKVNALAEVTATGATIATLTARPKLFADSEDAGFVDAAFALLPSSYSAVHDDATRDSTMAAIDALLAT